MKGGIIAFVLLIVIYIIVMIFSARWLCEYNDLGNINCSNAQVFSTFFLPFSSMPWIEGTIIILLITLCIGALFGWIYSKIKNSKKSR